MSKFQDAINDMKKKRDIAMQKITALVEAEAKLRTPVDTGQLKRSITHQVTSDDDKTVGRVGSNLSHAPYVELGTKHTQAQPYLRPAIEDNIELIKDIVKKEMSV